MRELEEAVARILATIPGHVAESVELAFAHGRVLAEPAMATIDLPPFDNSAMDGYAVHATDVAGARADAPVGLTLVGRIAAGQMFPGEMANGECIRLFTGSPLPKGADAVVMQEDTRVEDGRPNRVLILDSIQPGESVRFGGEDIRRGATLSQAGQVITAGTLGLLGAAGLKEVKVGRRPLIGLLATGSELMEAGRPLEPGQIYESNRLALARLTAQAGGIPRVFPVVEDELKATRAALAKAFEECDAVVTCGGASVGEMDFIKAAFAQEGGDLEFWKVAIKPGRPFVFGRRKAKLFFGLPGNPVSAFVTFLLLVRPALRKWQGAADVLLPTHPGTLAEPLPNSGPRRHFMRVEVDSKGGVRSAGAQASHVLSSLAGANGLVDVPPNTTLEPGARVQVLRWE